MFDEAKLAKEFVKCKVRKLSEDGSAAMVSLCQLREGIGQEPGSMLKICDITMDGLPEELTSKNGSPTCGERVVHTALTLYGFHQLGKDIKHCCMNKEGESFGISLRKLVKNESDKKRISHLLGLVISSSDLKGMSYLLRSIVHILKTHNIPLDYPALAEDLYLLQFESAKNSVAWRWGRDFYCGTR